MSIALVGPALGDVSMLESALRQLLFEQRYEQIFYFGEAAEAATSLERINREIQLHEPLIDTAVSLALMEDPSRSATKIDDVLKRIRLVRRLSTIRVVPDAPKKHVEMIRSRLMLLTRNHKHLDEDDIANATLIVYANEQKSVFKRFGKRAFFAPPPLPQNAVGLVTTNGARVDLSITTLGAETTWTEPILSPKTRMTVST